MSGLILGTFMPLTKGHENLIRFADKYIDTFGSGYLYVIISVRNNEPFVQERINALKKFCATITSYYIHVKVHSDDNAPQNPSNSSSEEEFWNYWKNVVNTLTQDPIDYVFASELYGSEMAKVLDAKFVPYNRYREVNDVSGTKVRHNVLHHFDQISSSFVPYIQQHVTFFGQESVGKTTMARTMAYRKASIWTPEWAREYLETFGAELSSEKMAEICRGQYVLQKSTCSGTPFIFHDTDLYSTVGYYRLWNVKEMPDDLIVHVKELQSDLYVLCNDSIPFEIDPLRYGGDKRETDMKFWEDILQEFNCNYVILKSVDIQSRLEECDQICQDLIWNKAKPLMEFIRT
jgi:HTH-type transcriptional regulator, transcriptional repressor of NAD biosynthesis genes